MLQAMLLRMLLLYLNENELSIIHIKLQQPPLLMVIKLYCFKHKIISNKCVQYETIKGLHKKLFPKL